MRHGFAIALLWCCLAGGASRAAAEPLRHKWLYLRMNFLSGESLRAATNLLERIAAEGYTGVALGDSKFMRWDSLPDGYRRTVRRVREACRRLQLDTVACVMPIGYSNDLLSRDPDLAEGLPVVDAPFVVRAGRLVPDETVTLANGGFEQSRDNRPAGWGFVDQPGRISWIDTAVRREGAAALRMQDVARHDPQHGNARACQTLRVRPFGYYHISVAVKTDRWNGPDTRIAVLGGQRALQFHTPRIEPTQDWRTLDVTFNSFEFREVNLYLGAWQAQSGTIWWDDVRVEPAGFVNVIRREGAPLAVRSEDRNTQYEEGRDFSPIRDPLLGRDPYAGEYTAWHAPPDVAIPPGSRLAEGQRVLVSYYHAAIVYDGQVACCLSAPALYPILEWQVRSVRDNVAPDGYFMQHDEIRAQGWDASCAATGKTCGQILADNIRRCAAIIRAADPGKPVYVWSDMFDPHHNARPDGAYYLVKGEGPWNGSWAGLDPDIGIVNWHPHTRRRADALRHFASLGCRQILAGYYDGDPRQIAGWLRDAAGIEGVDGVMYTTWRQDYTQTRAFLQALRGRSR